MTDQTLSADTHDTKSANQSILWGATAALLISFGATMFLFSAAYAKDVETLLKAPELVWAFICGQPSEYGVTLPLLLTAGTMAVLGGVVTTGVTWWRHRN